MISKIQVPLKNILLAAAIIVLIGVLIGVFRSRYVFIGNDKIPIDSTDIIIHCSGSKIGKSLQRLKRMPQIKLLNLYGVSDDDSLDHIHSANISDALIISFSEINNPLFVNSLGDIDLLFFQTNVDFKGVTNETHIDSLYLISCTISNLEEIGKCQSVKMLDINQCNFGDDDKLIGNRLDSTVLCEFDNVTTLELGGMEITDISGLLDMQSLRELKVDSNCISDKQLAELQDAGINVEIKEVSA